jgi:hypothetical protein
MSSASDTYNASVVTASNARLATVAASESQRQTDYHAAKTAYTSGPPYDAAMAAADAAHAGRVVAAEQARQAAVTAARNVFEAATGLHVTGF